MSDEQQTDTESPKRGRPRKRSVKREPVHKGAHRDDDDGQDPLENFEYRPFEAENPLSIDPDIVRGIENEWGYSLLWVAYEVNGKPFPQLVSARKRNHYAEIKKGNFGGCLDHMCDKDGGIRHEGLVLMARPVEIERIAKRHDARAAKAAVEQMKASHADEGLSGISMPDGNNAAARAKNVHRRSFERIPE